jgi:hypothetical protein
MCQYSAAKSIADSPWGRRTNMKRLVLLAAAIVGVKHFGLSRLTGWRLFGVDIAVRQPPMHCCQWLSWLG